MFRNHVIMFIIPFFSENLNMGVEYRFISAQRIEKGVDEIVLGLPYSILRYLRAGLKKKKITHAFSLRFELKTTRIGSDSATRLPVTFGVHRQDILKKMWMQGYCCSQPRTLTSKWIRFSGYLRTSQF